jgi:hypothetical protein
MKILKYKGETYIVSEPQCIGGRKYVCIARKERTQRIVRAPVTLNALGRMLMRGGNGNEQSIHRPNSKCP